MTATTKERFTDFVDRPGMVTAPLAAGFVCLKGTITCRDSLGNGGPPTAPGTNGDHAWGVNHNATVDNTGGAAGDLKAELSIGVMTLPYIQTAPLPNEKVYVVDNQTVSATESDGAAALRGVAGICTKVDTVNSLCSFHLNQAVTGAHL